MCRSCCGSGWDLLHEACVAPHPIAFHYVREDGTPSQREVRPLALYRWTASWTLATWCDLRKDFRVFRIDRMEGLRVLPATF